MPSRQEEKTPIVFSKIISYIVNLNQQPATMQRISYLIAMTALTFLSACVSSQEYAKLEAVKNYYAEEAEIADSLKYVNEAAQARIRQMESIIAQTTRELEASVIANNNLLNNFKSLSDQYNELVAQNRSELQTSSYEKLSLQEQLIAQRAAMDQQQNRLNSLEQELYEKERRLGDIAGGYDQIQMNLAQKNQKIQELENQLALQKQQLLDLRNRLNSLFRGISSSDLEITEKEGRLYVSLSQNLLFKKGSTTIDPKGKNAIRQLADILRNYPDIEITVEGHTDTDGTAARNWDLSVTRATSVVKELLQTGLDPRNVIASGRAFYLPVAPNDTESNKAKNRRTAIILAPRWSQIMQVLNQP